jgi:YHS domain-containing protein
MRNKLGTALLAAAIATSLGSTAAAAQGHSGHGKAAAKGSGTCPVMKAPIKDKSKAPHVMVNNKPVHVCCPGCIGEIKKTPAKFVKQVKDPVTGKSFTATAKSPKMEHKGAIFLFSSAKTHQTFHASPDKYHQQH